ncbi:MAG TPA: class I SAM-dependent methyltransferase [Saprospiraceae bacterium]|nr:class I SAM-dependent methyltransferase [Saprospiraceae bacterium]HPI05979.1 class I SAM-dependent methyltransferase [Saprospiraceae bacterium]
MTKNNDWNTYFEANRDGWNLRTEVHKSSAFYNVEAWKNGAESLNSIELGEIGDVDGKSLLHLQCHFGQDTMSWARKGATVTGCDLSDKAVGYARELAAELNIPAQFVCCNLYDLPEHLEGQFDVVFTSYGTIGWLPDLDRWAAVIAHFLKPGGFFYIADFHPVLWMLDDRMEYLKYPYHGGEVILTEQVGTYAERYSEIQYTEYGWNHSLSEIINSLIRHGLRIEFLNEFPYSPYDCFDKTVKGEDGNYRIQGLENIIPMVYSIKATKGL